MDIFKKEKGLGIVLLMHYLHEVLRNFTAVQISFLPYFLQE